MTLIRTSIEIIDQLTGLLKQLNNEEYSRELSVLSSNTIGKHVRHVVEFYECLLKGIPGGEINYDSRERNMNLETDIRYTLNILSSIQALMETNSKDIPLKLFMTYSEDGICSVDTTYFRELAYNIEHAVHHFAIISIAVKNELKHIELSKGFGIAYSTVKYQDSQKCAQ